MKWFWRALGLVIIAAFGWLYFSPPTVALDGTGARIACVPLGFETPGTVSPLTTSLEFDEKVQAYLESEGLVDDDTSVTEEREATLRARADIAAGCTDARLSRQSTLIALSAVGLGLLVWRRTSPAQPHPTSATPSKEN